MSSTKILKMAVLVGTLAIGQIVQTSLAQTTAGQIAQKVGQAAEKVAGQVMSGNKTGNQTLTKQLVEDSKVR